MRVRVSTEARQDVQRLFAFLGGRDAAAARRAADTLEEAIKSLSDMPDRARPGPGPYRELIVPFGSGAYIVQFRRDDRVVLIARIFHSLEDRPLA